MPPPDGTETWQTPAWLSALGSGVGEVAKGAGRFGANTLAILGHAPLPFPMGGPQQTGGWAHPERQALAMRYLPPELSDEDKATRMETFRLVPINNWPALIKQFQKSDLDAGKLHASPEYQDLYQQGGPDAVQQRYPGVPLPPSRRITLKDYPPLDDLDQAIAKAGGTENVPLPLPITGQGGPMFPPVAPGDAVKYETSRRQLGAMQRPGAEGDYAADVLAKVPPSIATNQELLGKLAPILQQAQQGGFVPEVQLAPDGYTVSLKNPSASAQASQMGTQRAQRMPLGGATAAPAPPRAGGNTGTETPAGKFFDLGNGQYADPQGNIVDQLPQGAATTPGTTVPADQPMRGQPSLSVENFPGATAADFDLLEEGQRNALKLEYEKQLAATKGKTLNEDERKRVSQIQAARAFLNVYEQYGTKTGSTLPTARVSGPTAIMELGRQSGLVQGVARDPYLQGLQRYQALGKPILARNIGGDVGNLSETEQKVVGAVLSAASQPELTDAVEQMRALLDAREQELTGGKAGGEKTPTAKPTVSPEEAKAELRRRGVEVP